MLTVARNDKTFQGRVVPKNGNMKAYCNTFILIFDSREYPVLFGLLKRNLGLLFYICPTIHVWLDIEAESVDNSGMAHKLYSSKNR